MLNVDRGVPEVWGSVYDIRDLLNATVALRDGKKIIDLQLGFIQDIVLKAANSRGNHISRLKLSSYSSCPILPLRLSHNRVKILSVDKEIKRE